MNKWRRSAGAAVTVAVISVYLVSCGALQDRPAQDDLSLAIAGMTGTDGVSFEGAAGLLRANKAVPETSIYYGGQVRDHDQVSLYTLLPDAKSDKKLGDGDGLAKLTHQSSTSAKAYTVKMEKRNGKWTLGSDSVSDRQGNPLPRLNPLARLEELETLDKTVTEAAGAARGTRELRIELTPSQAKAQLADELQEEMLALRPSATGLSKEKYQRLESLWMKQNEKMRQMLLPADIKTVYYLTVDAKRNLPKRLTCNRTVKFAGQAEETASETYVMQIDFYGYR